jgi:hypothetical protein
VDHDYIYLIGQLDSYVYIDPVGYNIMTISELTGFKVLPVRTVTALVTKFDWPTIIF